MAKTIYNPNGGPITISPIMQGPMNCGYTLDAYKSGSFTAFLSVSGDIENIQPLTFASPAAMGENTRIFCSFLFRAGNSQLVGSKYKLGMVANQDGIQLESHEESDPAGTLPEEVQMDQYVLIMTKKDAK